MIDRPSHSRPLAYWLFACCALVFLIVIVGAVTRLTGSGLSMAEWRPLTGFLPPLNETEWQRVFDLYKATPEYTKVNFWMELPDFKNIFFWEWFHRLLGRSIGIAYALPLAFFWIAGMIPSGYKLKLTGIFLLGGAQGLLGWFMVQSGLIDIPAVSHYRLAAHLGLALLIFSAMLWQGLNLWPAPRTPSKALYPQGLLVLLFVCMTILWGAFTAGLDAGLVYNETFPLMGSRIIPPDMWFHDPAWINLFEHHPAVQFTHRWLAVFTALMVLGFWLRAQIRKESFGALNVLALMILVQVGLGIATLLSGVSLPLAAAHQASAVVVLALLIASLRRLQPHTH